MQLAVGETASEPKKRRKRKTIVLKGKPERRQRWKLSKTLSRDIGFREIEESDLKYMWAAYRQGAFDELFEDEREKSASEFDVLMAQHINSLSAGAWVFEAKPPRRDRMPVGVIFGEMHPMVSVMIIAGTVWFPWASPRNVVEGTILFLENVRHKVPVMGYAKDHQKRLYETAMKHGIMRRIGTSHSIWPEEKSILFETRTP